MIYTGESILIPELHDQRGMMQCLLERGGINLSPIQPQISNFTDNEQLFTSHGHRISTSMIDEGRLFALQNKRHPTMAKFPTKRNELVWCGWNLLLNPEGN